MVSIRKPDIKPKEQPEEGAHVARLLGITDLGHQPGFVHNGKAVPSEYKLEFTYELVNTQMEDGRPFVISEEMTNKDWEDEKTGRASTLVSRCKAMCGREYKTALSDINSLLTRPCMVTVTYNDKGYARIRGQAAVGSVPSGFPIPDLQNGTYIFDQNAPDMERWESLPDFKKEKIQNGLDFHETELARILAEGDEY